MAPGDGLMSRCLEAAPEAAKEKHGSPVPPRGSSPERVHHVPCSAGGITDVPGDSSSTAGSAAGGGDTVTVGAGVAGGGPASSSVTTLCQNHVIAAPSTAPTTQATIQTRAVGACAVPRTGR